MAEVAPSPGTKKQISDILKMLGYGRQRSEQERQQQGAIPLDVIFSCCICNATFSEIYKGPCETVKMLSDGLNPKDRIVSRLFLASCCHVFCGKHLEGGGPPFHPAGSRPRAPCPICKQDGDLYSVRGFIPGEYDSAIPPCWFVTPPMKLDSSGKEMEALRFQYMSLITYSTKITDEHRKIQQELAEARDDANKAQVWASEEHEKVVGLERKNQELQAADSELQRFRSRVPAIQHYLKCIPKLVEQNELMRDRLASLGFQMHFEPLEYKEGCSLEEMDGALGLDTVHSRTTSNYTGDKSADTLVNGDHSMSSTPKDRPLKRQRMESPPPSRNIHAVPQQRGVTSRDIMPPPAKPLSKMKSIRKLWPTLRKKASHGLASSSVGSHRQGPSESVSVNTHMEEDGYGMYSDASRPPPTPHAKGQSEGHYMTGALPVENYDDTGALPVEDYENGPHFPPPLNLNGASANFTFRQPMQTPSMRPANLPSEPSYIRLMDGLSNDAGLDLGIMDPRSELEQEMEERQRDIEYAKTLRAKHAESVNRDYAKALRSKHDESVNRWSLGHAFLHQSPTGPNSPGPKHPDPLRSNPVTRPTSNTNAIFQRTRHPVTPAPQRSQQHSGLEESVVSPFFKSSNRSSRNFSRAGVNQRDDSLQRSSAAYPYQRQQTSAERTDWREGRSLNALSFFNSPLNTRNEPILHRTRYGEQNPFTTSERRYTANNLTANGFIKRPDRETFKHDSVLNVSLGDNGYMHPASTSSFDASTFPSKPTVLSRPARLPASVPSIGSGQHAGRASRNGYIHPGIRSGRVSAAPRNSIRDNGYAPPARNVFSSSGRRTVRR